jgi:cytoskeletal protein CcmA (bactofilin family)
MREERGTIAGPVTIDEPYTLWGSIGGDVTVVDGGKFYMRGSIYGNLKVANGGRVHIYGNISGNLTVEEGTKVIHSGNLAGDAFNNGGRLFVDATATIKGKVKTVGGETKFEPMQVVPGAKQRDGE